MKKIVILFSAGMFLLATGCKEKKASSEIIVKQVAEQKISDEPVKMQEYTQSTEVEWKGTTVNCEVVRMPDENKSLVEDERGQKHVDNKITLKITGADGKEFMNRTFGKGDFMAYLDEEYKQGGLLEGIVYDRVQGDTLLFAASVSLPQTDEYIPLVIYVLKNGQITISRDVLMDTYGEE